MRVRRSERAALGGTKGAWLYVCCGCALISALAAYWDIVSWYVANGIIAACLLVMVRLALRHADQDNG